MQNIKYHSNILVSFDILKKNPFVSFQKFKIFPCSKKDISLLMATANLCVTNNYTNKCWRGQKKESRMDNLPGTRQNKILLMLNNMFASGGFDWDQYLKDCEAEPAPQSCFKQVRLLLSSLLTLILSESNVSTSFVNISENSKLFSPWYC